MKLYLVRHATAVDTAPTDADRELTREGKQEARVAGRALARLKTKPQFILSSPLVRAVQTAELLAEELDFRDDIVKLTEPENGPSTSALLRALKPYSRADELVLVGHMPSLAEHLAELIGVKNTRGLQIGKGSVVCLKTEVLREGAAELRWWLRQKQLALIAETD
ncbi:MAG: phosphohistidine phosphatase SixA [Verrucomicrobiae bacterium]|nr:phosphohistidine phosphatase SixA [Verrucomicrobiae bacterium]